MSEDESFLRRWSRRKREAPTSPRLRGEVDRRPSAAVLSAKERRREASAMRSASGEGGSPNAQAVEKPPHPEPLPASGERETETAFDPASLPPIESIHAGTDVRAFLRPGVPPDLARAALRRAWLADPAIRDFIGPAENAWDFNAPDGVPGFGPLRAVDDALRLAAQLTGGVRPEGTDAPAAPPAPPAQAAEPAQQLPPRSVSADPISPAPASDDAVQKEESTEQRLAPVRRRHGGALAE
jgi:hypothetical protein